MASEKFEAPDLQKFIAVLRLDADHPDYLRNSSDQCWGTWTRTKNN